MLAVECLDVAQGMTVALRAALAETWPQAGCTQEDDINSKGLTGRGLSNNPSFCWGLGTDGAERSGLSKKRHLGHTWKKEKKNVWKRKMSPQWGKGVRVCVKGIVQLSLLMALYVSVQDQRHKRQNYSWGGNILYLVREYLQHFWNAYNMVIS